MVKNGNRGSLIDREKEAAAALEEPSKSDGVDIELLRRQDHLRRTLRLSNNQMRLKTEIPTYYLTI